MKSTDRTIDRLRKVADRNHDKRNRENPEVTARVLTEAIAEFREKHERDPVIMRHYGNAHLADSQIGGSLDEAIAKRTGLAVQTASVVPVEAGLEGKAISTGRQGEHRKGLFKEHFPAGTDWTITVRPSLGCARKSL